MATRKKVPEQTQMLAFPSMTAPAPSPATDPTIAPPPTPVVAERKLSLVPPLDRGSEEDVVVEPDGERFAVSLVRHYGTTVATVLYSRTQLEMLLARIPAALRVV